MRNIPCDMCAQRRLKSASTSNLFSVIKVFTFHMNFASLAIQNVPSEDSDQTVQMHSLIRIFSGHTCPKVYFWLLQLICIFFLQ